MQWIEREKKKAVEWGPIKKKNDLLLFILYVDTECYIKIYHIYLNKTTIR